jgi:hypothetical protein
MLSPPSQQALRGLGPELDDGFRFTWWTTRDGDRVWVEHRCRWRAGVIVGRGRERVTVAIAGADSGRRSVRRSYSELRRRR